MEGAIRIFVAREIPEKWWGKVWEGGRLVPSRRRDRFRLRVPLGGQGGNPPQIPIPPPPDSFPVPIGYRIRYEGGVSLEVRPHGTGADSWGGALRRWLDEATSAIHPWSGDRLRLRVLLRPEDADALYRALPPDTRLFVLPPNH